MTNAERKIIEKALKTVMRNNSAYDKAAKRLGAAMFAPATEYFNEAADDEEKDTLIALMHLLYKFYELERVPLFFADVILDDSVKIEIRKTAARMLPYCHANVPLDKIRQICSMKKFRLEALECLPFCENEERHQFAVEVLKEQQNPQMAEAAAYSLIAEKVAPEDADLLKTIYSQSKDPYLRYHIMELLYKSSTEDLHDYFISAYKKERLLPNRLQAIIGLYVKSDIETADKTMIGFVNGIVKRKNLSGHSLDDLRGMVEWLDELKEIYPSKGFNYAYETLSAMDVLRSKI